MIVTQRKARRQKEGASRTAQCQVTTCNRSGRYDAQILHTKVILCKAHAEEWQEAYEWALDGCPDRAEVAA